MSPLPVDRVMLGDLVRVTVESVLRRYPQASIKPGTVLDTDPTKIREITVQLDDQLSTIYPDSVLGSGLATGDRVMVIMSNQGAFIFGRITTPRPVTWSPSFTQTSGVFGLQSDTRAYYTISNGRLHANIWAKVIGAGTPGADIHLAAPLPGLVEPNWHCVGNGFVESKTAGWVPLAVELSGSGTDIVFDRTDVVPVGAVGTNPSIQLSTDDVIDICFSYVLA